MRAAARGLPVRGNHPEECLSADVEADFLHGTEAGAYHLAHGHTRDSGFSLGGLDVAVPSSTKFGFALVVSEQGIFDIAGRSIQPRFPLSNSPHVTT